MSMIRGTIFVCLILALTQIVRPTRTIGYGSMSGGGNKCNQRRQFSGPLPQGCLPPPSNPYNRGCSAIDRCRHGKAPAGGNVEEVAVSPVGR